MSQGVTRFGDMLRLWRTVNRVSLRDVAAECNVSASTLNRLERGHACDADSWLALQGWLLGKLGTAPGDARPARVPDEPAAGDLLEG